MKHIDAIDQKISNFFN